MGRPPCDSSREEDSDRVERAGGRDDDRRGGSHGEDQRAVDRAPQPRVGSF